MKILYVTTISPTINAFFKPHIQMLINEGHSVDLACNYQDTPLDEFYSRLGCNFHQIDFSRSPLSSSNLRAYGQLKQLIKVSNYDIVHCHTPNAAAITRLVCRKFRKKNGLKVFYTAHGFHFYKGAPLKNWLLYYPVEKICSHFTDLILTMNLEDYTLAQKKMKAKSVAYVHGVGIDLSRFDVEADENVKRQEIGVPENAVVLISVGELIERKNHKVVLKALSEINDDNIHYVIVGKGPLHQELEEYARTLNIAGKVHFLGYRKDVPELYKAADVCCFPSIHEGLPVALMEAMACGLPVVCSKIRGNTDLVNDEYSGFLVDTNDIKGYVTAIAKISADKLMQKDFGEKNKQKVRDFSLDIVLEEMKKLYE